MDKGIEELDEEYSKDTNLDKKTVLEILEWTQEQPHLPKMTEFQAILFLKSCNYNLNSTKMTVDNYFTLRTRFRDIFDMPSNESLDSFSLLTVLPQRTTEDYIVFLSTLIDCRIEVYDSVQFWRLFNMVVLLNLAKFGSAKGLLIIFDIDKTTFGHFTRTNWTQMKKVLQYLEEAAPYKLQGVHFINTKYFAYKTVQWVKCFARNETANMMHFHQTLKTLWQTIPRESLPEEFGGGSFSIQSLFQDQKKLLVENIELFRFLDSQKVDENQRPKINEEMSNQSLFKRFGSFVWKNRKSQSN